MEGHESSESDPCQGKLQKDLDYAKIPMYTVLVVKPTYIRAYSFKSHMYHFHMFLGMVRETSKDKKWSMGCNKSAMGQGKAIQSVIHLTGEISYNNRKVRTFLISRT